MTKLALAAMPFVTWLLPRSIRMHMAMSCKASDPPEAWAVSMTAAQMLRATIFAILAPLFVLQCVIALMAR